MRCVQLIHKIIIEILNVFLYRSSSVYTFQALSEEDRSLWMDAMDGKEPMYVHAPKPSNAHQVIMHTIFRMHTAHTDCTGF